MRRTWTIVLLTVACVSVAFSVLYVSGLIPYKFEIVHTGSMEPTIPSGNAVLIHRGHYSIGNAVTYVVHHETITHRLLSVDASGDMTTKGDANARPDPWHPPTTAITGGVIANVRYLGYVLYYVFGTPTGALSIVLLFVLLWQVKALAREVFPDPSPDEEAALVASATTSA